VSTREDDAVSRAGKIDRGRRVLAPNRHRPDSADIPTGERAVRRELLHLLRDFSQ